MHELHLPAAGLVLDLLAGGQPAGDGRHVCWLSKGRPGLAVLPSRPSLLGREDIERERERERKNKYI